MAIRNTLLTIGTLAAICLWGLSVYSADALGGKVADDGYGISAAFESRQN